MLLQEICFSCESLMNRNHWKKDSATFLWLLKLLKLKKNCTTALPLKVFNTEKRTASLFLTPVKVFNTEKGHHHCINVFSAERGLHHFLRTLKVFNIEKGLHHFLGTLKDLNFEKWLHHILMTLKVFQNIYSGEQSLVNVAYYIIFMINKLHLLWGPNFIALGINFLFGAKFSWNEETDTYFNVEYVLLDGNFDFLGYYLVVTALYLMVIRLLFVTFWLLLVTPRYCSFPF